MHHKVEKGSNQKQREDGLDWVFFLFANQHYGDGENCGKKDRGCDGVREGTMPGEKGRRPQVRTELIEIGGSAGKPAPREWGSRTCRATVALSTHGGHT